MDYQALDDAALLEALTDELDMHEALLTVVMQPTAALIFAGLLQLVLRHPEIHTASNPASLALTFLDHVRDYFADCPAACEVMRRGDVARFRIM